MKGIKTQKKWEIHVVIKKLIFSCSWNGKRNAWYYASFTKIIVYSATFIYWAKNNSNAFWLVLRNHRKDTDDVLRSTYSMVKRSYDYKNSFFDSLNVPRWQLMLLQGVCTHAKFHDSGLPPYVLAKALKAGWILQIVKY